MAKSFTSVPGNIVFTLGGADVATQINMPNKARKLTVYFEANAGKFSAMGADGDSPINAAYLPVSANQHYEIWADSDTVENGKGPAPIMVASGVAGTVVRAFAESGG